LEPEVRLIPDTPDVRALLSSEEKIDAPELGWLKGSQSHDERVRGVDARRRHPEQYAPSLAQFTKVMDSKRTISVPGGTLCRIVQRSEARCTLYAFDTLTFVKIRIVDGKKRGQEAWACEGRDVFATASYKLF
jgi:hypothetical protein